MTAAIHQSSSFLAPQPMAEARSPRRTLGQEDFLRLLTVQLASQDPLKPMDDTAFIAQMAQFTALEQSNTLAREMSLMRADSSLQAGTALIGKEVSGATKFGPFHGVVDSIEQIDGEVMLGIGEDLWPLRAVMRVAPSTSNPTPENSNQPPSILNP
jgi:flagellar basal-body rod modification protein FlgD